MWVDLAEVARPPGEVPNDWTSLLSSPSGVLPPPSQSDWNSPSRGVHPLSSGPDWSSLLPSPGGVPPSPDGWDSPPHSPRVPLVPLPTLPTGYSCTAPAGPIKVRKAKKSKRKVQLTAEKIPGISPINTTLSKNYESKEYEDIILATMALLAKLPTEDKLYKWARKARTAWVILLTCAQSNANHTISLTTTIRVPNESNISKGASEEFRIFHSLLSQKQLSTRDVNVVSSRLEQLKRGVPSVLTEGILELVDFLR